MCLCPQSDKKGHTFETLWKLCAFQLWPLEQCFPVPNLNFSLCPMGLILAILHPPWSLMVTQFSPWLWGSSSDGIKCPSTCPTVGL